MALLNIGAFAAAVGLSPKALRLYDELGLVKPAVVDAGSGYRFYAPGQIAQAQQVAWLRRIGMPLARIRIVCDLEPAVAADEVAAYWSAVVADTEARGQLASFLVDYLSGKGATLTTTPNTLGIRFATRVDAGMGRETNEDLAYAGATALAVADGTRGHGGQASAAAIAAIRALESETLADDPLTALADAVDKADQAVGAIAASAGDGATATTLTAMVLSGADLTLVHIGDTRAYLHRDGELFQITHDHSYVQSLVDEGRLTAAEARSHPKRALLVRALDGTGRHQPDIERRSARPGDRYLLCSDGLSAVVSDSALAHVLAGVENLDEVADRLVELAYDNGAPDNIACVVADVVEL